MQIKNLAINASPAIPINPQFNLKIMKKFSAAIAIAIAATPVMAQTQYYGPSYYGSPGSNPVVVPPTVITTNAPVPLEHNSSKKSCKESIIDLFLFAIRRTTGDCTP